MEYNKLYAIVGINAENTPEPFSNTHFLAYADKDKADKTCVQYNEYLKRNKIQSIRGKFVVDTLDNIKLSYPDAKIDYGLVS